MAINGSELVEKRNVLNEIRKNNMNLQELRFFSIYLSKINARKPETRKVTFPVDDFKKIMELGRINIKHMQMVTNRLLCNVVNIKRPDGGYEAFQIFKRCKVYKDKFERWFIEIDAHDDALPLMFEFKKEYFTYELWNALRLKSVNQLRMYELLKQYEKAGERKVTLQDLRELLGVEEKEYSRWDNFKRRVLDSCQEALAENTDICFEYEPIKAGRKIVGIHFFIKKNPRHVDELSLDEFIEQQEELDDDDARGRRDEICNGFSDELFDEFTDDQLIELRSLAWENVDYDRVMVHQSVLGNARIAKEYAVTEYITQKIRLCNAKEDVRHRYSFIKSAVERDFH